MGGLTGEALLQSRRKKKYKNVNYFPLPFLRSNSFHVHPLLPLKFIADNKKPPKEILANVIWTPCYVLVYNPKSCPVSYRLLWAMLFFCLWWKHILKQINALDNDYASKHMKHTIKYLIVIFLFNFIFKSLHGSNTFPIQETFYWVLAIWSS